MAFRAFNFFDGLLEPRHRPTPGADRTIATMYDLMEREPDRYKLVPDENLIGSKIARFFLYNDNIICLSPAMHSLIKDTDDPEELNTIAKAIDVHPAIDHDAKLRQTINYLQGE